MLKIRRPLGRLIFNMGIATPGKTVFIIETAPRELYIWQLLSDTPCTIKCMSHDFVCICPKISPMATQKRVMKFKGPVVTKDFII